MQSPWVGEALARASGLLPPSTSNFGVIAGTEVDVSVAMTFLEAG
jgi:hypothetical protein